MVKQFGSNDLMLVTGASGLVGSHVVERACRERIPTRVLVRPSSNTKLLKDWGCEIFTGDMSNRRSLEEAAQNVTIVVHCAAKVGDWGPIDEYRSINVHGLEYLLTAAERSGKLKRMIHISSLGVYEARDHHGTDETEPPSSGGIDGYTKTKCEAEELVMRHVRDHKLPATILRPGFIYGPRDRTVLPRLMQRIKDRAFAFLGSGDQLMNNTYVGNLVDAVFLALQRDETIGGVYNITDGRLVSKKEFINTVAQMAGYEVPTRKVPLGVARVIARVLEKTWRMLGKQEAPVLSNARIKFLGLNLDFCIDKAKRELGYNPQVAFPDGMKQTMDWFKAQRMV